MRARAATKAPAPKEITATVARNRIMKEFKGKRGYSGESNPYSDVQELRANIPKRSVNRLEQWLLDEGYDKRGSVWDYYDPAMIVGGEYTKGKSRITTNKNGNIRCYGPKKRKAFTIPYYD